MARPLSIDDPITTVVDGRETQTTKGEAILNAIAIGVPKEIAAQAAGISSTTFFRWQAQVIEIAEMEESALTANQLRLREFWEDVEKAEAKAVVFAVGMVRKAMPHSWQAAMTFLERRQREHFARNVKLDHGGKIAVEVEAEVDEAIEGLVEQLGAGDPSDPRGE